MKKMLALLLALLMALSCVGAVAEEPASDGIGFELPSVTMTYEITSVDEEAVMALLPMFGMGEEMLPVVQVILPVLSSLTEKLVIADFGVQFDLGLKGQNVLTLAGELNDDGIAVASDILPSFVLTLSAEAVEKMLDQFINEATEALSSVEMDKLIENVMGYAIEYAQVCMEAVSFGEPEKGEYTFDEMAFNTKTPITIDTEALKAGMQKLINQFNGDENIAALLSALKSMGLEVPADEEEITIIMPEIVCNAYTNTDDEGNETDAVVYVVTETVTTVENQSLAVNVYVLVYEGGVAVEVDMPEQQVNICFDFAMIEDGLALGFDLNAMGVYIGAAALVTMDEEIVIDAEVYFMNPEKPIMTEKTTITMGGERTFVIADENKTAVDIMALFNELQGGECELLNSLMADIMGNGLNVLLTNAMQAMPEEMTAIMMLFAPAAEAVEGAAE